MDSLDELLAIAHAVLDDAERLFLEAKGGDVLHAKGKGDFCTETDRAIEQHVRLMLGQLTGISVYGVEFGGRDESQPQWVIDPIDGTGNFAAGNPMSAILLSLVIGEQPVLAICCLPHLGYRVHALEGGPLFVNGQPHTPSRVDNPILTQLGFGSIASPTDSRFPTRLRHDLLGELIDEFPRLRITGSVGVDLAFVALGIFGGAVTFSPHLWDNAAGVLLVRAAGGTVTGLDGKPWTAHSRGVVAGHPDVHRIIMQSPALARGNEN